MIKQIIINRIREGLATIVATGIISTAFCSALKQFNDPYVMPEEFAKARWVPTKVQGVGDVYTEYVVQEFNREEHLRWDTYVDAVFAKNHIEAESLLVGRILLPRF